MAEGRKQAAILKSEAEKAQLINEAEGQVSHNKQSLIPSIRSFNMVWSHHKLLDGMTPFLLFRLELLLSLVRPEQRAYRQLLKLLEEPRSLKAEAYLQHFAALMIAPLQNLLKQGGQAASLAVAENYVRVSDFMYYSKSGGAKYVLRL